MSEERKIINQQFKIKGDVTISDVVTSIPSGFNGPIFITGDLTITDDDILNFGYSDMWIFNEMHISGNLREDINKKNADLLKLDEIWLTVQGDLYCDKSIILNHLALLVRGNIETYGDINAREIKVSGDLYSDLSVTATNDIIIRGDFTSGYNILASYIDVRGNLVCDTVCAKDINVLGNFSFENSGCLDGVKIDNNLHVRGNMMCTSLEATNISIGGYLICDTSIKTDGSLIVGGDLKCCSIDSKDEIIIICKRLILG